MSTEDRLNRLDDKVAKLETDVDALQNKTDRLRVRIATLELYSDADAWERLGHLIEQAIAEGAGMAEARAAAATECTILSRDDDAFRMLFWCDDVTFDLISVDYRNATGRNAVLVATNSDTGELITSIDLTPTNAAGVSVSIPPGRRPNMNRNSLTMSYTSPPPA